MGFPLCYSLNEISVSSLQYISQSRPIPKALVSFGELRNRNRHKLVVCKISSHFMGDLEGSYAAEFPHEQSSVELGFLRTLLIDNYDSYTYNIYQELSVINGVAPVVIYNDTSRWEEIYHYVYELKAFDNIVISPGPGTPSCPADIGICLRLLLECPDIPILGICLGHQALGYAHGARIIHAPEPIHGRLSDIEHTNCELFLGIPSGRNSGFKVVRYHSLVIDPKSLPEELIPIAWTSSHMTPFSEIRKFDFPLNGHPFSSKSSYRMDNENLDGNVLMGIMHSTRPHYGLQFHPESVATSYGRQIFKNFADITKNYWSIMKSSSLNMELQHSVANQMRTARLFEDVAKYLVNKSVSNGSLMRSYSTKSKFLKLAWRKVKCTASQLGGAKNIFCNIFYQNRAANTFWLDSSSTEMSRARFSFMGGKGGSLWKQVTFRLANESNSSTNRGGYLCVEDAEGSSRTTYLEDGFFSFLNKELQSFCYDAADYEALPFDFYGGYVGYIGYDLKVECGVSENQHKSSTPDACLFFTDSLLIIDHHCDDIYLLSLLDANTSKTPWLDDYEQKLMDMAASPLTNATPSECVVYSEDSGFSIEKSREQYIRDINKCRKFIKDGESYEICLTTQMKRRVDEIDDSLGLYLNLRGRNPAPYSAWLDFTKENLCICCSSPERFLRLNKDGTLEAKPIKGTIRRGNSLEEDEQLKLQLQYSEKDQAENLMIVDLLRNDLGRVCEPGSVHVPNLMEIESYTNIHTMVSTIRGKKRCNVSAVDSVRSAFPGGSMTGAPKLRSMEIIERIESCSRGIYSGSIGYFCYNQTFDLNIVIRSIVIHEGEASIGAGGAITALSIPDDEYEEMMLKAKAPSSAVMESIKARL